MNSVLTSVVFVCPQGDKKANVHKAHKGKGRLG